ncbi:TPA: restriction endonuclease subunit M [Vibrio fluvialis]|nr:N-6 DNA methylase [Vibrio fluvialis]EKO3477999.1 N-6 DNA methylase [Vibrio fluvialis]
MNDLIEKGLTKGLISFDAEQKNITYIRQNKRLRFTDPEEKVRVNAYLSLVCDYGYSAEQIDIEVTVEHRVPTIFSDIVVYADKSLKKPVIVVECKREEASQGELDQAVEQGFGYANSMDADFVWMTSGLRNDYFRRDRKAPKERVANRLADLPRAGGNISRAKYVKGGQGGFELKTVEENELTRIFKQAHDALWAGGKRNPAEAFDELDKLIFCKIWDERAKRKNGEPYDFQVFSDDKGDALKVRIHNLYLEGRKKDAEVFKEDIRLSNAELQTVVGYLAATNLNKTDLDSKGRAFETFMTGFFRGEFGQYFTPRKIVQFIVDALPITNESKVLDTSCGSGGFLLHALDKVRKQADQKAKEGYFDPATPEGYKEHFDFWHDFAEDNLFGIEISEGIARTAKMNMIIHDDGHTNVIAFDGLESIDTMREKTKNKGFKADTFDFIITNPPFGSKVKFVEKRYLENYELGKKGEDWIDVKLKGLSTHVKLANTVKNDDEVGKDRRPTRDQQTTEVLFIEQCHRFLKPGGYLAMVIPDSILTNSSMQYVRNWIEEHWRIVAVVSLPQFAFAANGAGVKSSVMFLKKYNAQTTAAIQAIKTQVQDDLFGNQSQGQALKALLKEKKTALKKGDQTIQDIENALIAKLETLEVQGTLTASIKKSLNAEAKAEIKAHMATEAYEEWKQATNEDYNERIANLREALEDDFLAKVKAQVEDYPIFMAIAEDIGYDATGRSTSQNELDTVTPELARFLEQLEAGYPRPFA